MFRSTAGLVFGEIMFIIAFLVSQHVFSIIILLSQLLGTFSFKDFSNVS